MAVRTITLREAAEQFQKHLEIRGLEFRSVKSHRAGHNHMLETWGNISVSNITPRHVDDFFQSHDWAPGTRNLYLGNMRQFFEFCRTHGYMRRDVDPTYHWRNAKVERKTKLRVPVEEFNDLMDATDHPRDRAVIALGLFTFMRGSELQTLRISDLDLSRFELRMRRHKTKEDDVLPVSSELAEEMVRWLNWVEQDQKHLNPNWYLLPSKNPIIWLHDPITRRLKQSGVPSSLRPAQKMSHPYRVAQRALAKLGYDTHGEGEHTLRRSGARAMADELRKMGYDGALMRVASMLGHKDTRMTERYIGWELERTQRNEQIAGKPMFGKALRQPGRVLKVVGE